jgi:transposase-like protein
MRSDRSKRRESSVDEALVEMYLAGVSVRSVEDITEALWARDHCKALCGCSKLQSVNQA